MVMEIHTTLETPVECEVSPKDKKNNIKTGLRNIAMITRKRAYMRSGENKAIQYNTFTPHIITAQVLCRHELLTDTNMTIMTEV